MARIASEAEIQLAESTYRNDPHAADEGLFVHFYNGAVFNAMKTKEAKRPMFDDAICIQIQVPGDNTLAIDRQADIDEDNDHNKEAHNNRFPKHWAAFKKGLESGEGVGIPLTALKSLPPSVREELKHSKVRTVEQLAHMSDSNITRMGPGFIEYRKRAVAFLAAQRDAEPLEQVKAELSSRDEKIAALEHKLAELAKQKSR